MTEIVRDRVLVLRVIPYSETSLILTVFSRSRGKLGLLAKGARRKIKNGSALAIEPAYELEAVWGQKTTRDLQIVREFTLLTSRYSLRSAPESLVIAQAISELLLRSLRDEDPHTELFDFALQTLGCCETRGKDLLPVFWRFELELLSQIGFAPGESGFAGSSTAPLSGEASAVLRKLRTSPLDMAAKLRVSPAAEREISLWFSTYFLHHLAFPAQLRSLEALRWARHKRY
ncbi:MAG: DNA repair protein RecO [Calditrichaeota bacterium]|nr:DNA repair protein RecO [Calditrichota bacterium]MCB9366845.1 DNA repair protein RecO [Calditrichota bacterium]